MAPLPTGLCPPKIDASQADAVAAWVFSDFQDSRSLSIHSFSYTAIRHLYDICQISCGRPLSGVLSMVLTCTGVQVGFPVMIKATAGGGGKGMRLSHTEDDFMRLLQQAQSEAAAAFGNDAVYLERYIQNPRHIEFQVHQQLLTGLQAAIHFEPLPRPAESHSSGFHYWIWDLQLRSGNDRKLTLYGRQHASLANTSRTHACLDALALCQRLDD